MVTLEEVKETAEEFLKRQIAMMQKISTLDREDVIRFNQWYTTNPHYIKLQELVLVTKQDNL